MKIVRFAWGWRRSGARRDWVAGLWRWEDGSNETAMGACEKLRVVMELSLCVLPTAEDLIVGHERDLEKQRVADLEAMIVMCEVLVVVEGRSTNVRVGVAKSPRFTLLSNDASRDDHHLKVGLCDSSPMLV
jgi:hypothetical protein